MRRTYGLALGAGLWLLAAPAARAQFGNGEVQIDPALGNRPYFGPGGSITNGNGYNGVNPGNSGYYTGLYQAPNDMSNGPSPYYSPLYPAITNGPRTGFEPPVLPKPKPAKGLAGVPTRLANAIFRHR